MPGSKNLSWFINFDETCSFYFLAGWTVSEEKQKNAGHFNPVCYSCCSNTYSICDKIWLIMHSIAFGMSVWVFSVHLCALVWGSLLSLSVLQNDPTCLSYLLVNSWRPLPPALGHLLYYVHDSRKWLRILYNRPAVKPSFCFNVLKSEMKDSIPYLSLRRMTNERSWHRLTFYLGTI